MFVKLPAMTASKAQLYIVLRESGTTGRNSPRRLGWHREQVIAYSGSTMHPGLNV